jgi:hypothetical protein
VLEHDLERLVAAHVRLARELEQILTGRAQALGRRRRARPPPAVVVVERRAAQAQRQALRLLIDHFWGDTHDHRRVVADHAEAAELDLVAEACDALAALALKAQEAFADARHDDEDRQRHREQRHR